MGVVGVWVGRHCGLALTTFFTILGVVGGVAFSWPGCGLWHIIAVCGLLVTSALGGCIPTARRQ